jgi:hypothetical protein
MTGWIIAACLYLLGCFEVWMIRRPVLPNELLAAVLGTVFWPILVPVAFVTGD